jgi:hypothetical protein
MRLTGGSNEEMVEAPQGAISIHEPHSLYGRRSRSELPPAESVAAVDDAVRERELAPARHGGPR